MRTPPRYDLTHEPSSELLDDVKALLRAYNRSRNPVFFAARDLPENAARPLCVFARGADGACVGGLIGETAFAWLHVEILVVHEDHRGCGIGAELMRLAETEAAGRGCRYAVLDTMSYQAPGFYEKVGYRVAGRFDDWDSHGHTKFYFTKTLV